MAQTTSGTLSQVIQRYYDKVFLERSIPEFVYKKLGRLGIIPGGNGTTVFWTRYTNPTAKTTALTEGTDPTPSGLSAINVTANVAQYGNYEQVTDVLDLAGIDNTIKSVVEVLAYEAANTIDVVVRNTVAAGGTVVYASAVANRTSIAATNITQVADIRKAVRALKRFAAPVHPFGNEKGYVAVIHPDVEYDLQGDSNWTSAHYYTDVGVTDVYSGKVGKLYGTSFLTTPNAPVLTASGSASTNVYQTMVMGADFFGVSELQGLTTYVDSPSPRSALRLYSDIGWKTGFAAAVLNASFGVRIESAATQ